MRKALEVEDKIAILMLYRIEKTDELIPKIVVLRNRVKDMDSTDPLQTCMKAMKVSLEFQSTLSMRESRLACLQKFLNTQIQNPRICPTIKLRKIISSLSRKLNNPCKILVCKFSDSTIITRLRIGVLITTKL
jgi:hypothetical protein